MVRAQNFVATIATVEICQFSVLRRVYTSLTQGGLIRLDAGNLGAMPMYADTLYCALLENSKLLS